MSIGFNEQEYYIESARQIVLNKGHCCDSENYIYCPYCFYAKRRAGRQVAGVSHCGGVRSHEKHLTDALAFIARHETPTHIELEGLE